MKKQQKQQQKRKEKEKEKKKKKKKRGSRAGSAECSPCGEVYVVRDAADTLQAISVRCYAPSVADDNPHIADYDDLSPGAVLLIASTRPPCHDDDIVDDDGDIVDDDDDGDNVDDDNVVDNDNVDDDDDFGDSLSHLVMPSMSR
jgi:hypothetical protein